MESARFSVRYAVAAGPRKGESCASYLWLLAMRIVLLVAAMPGSACARGWGYAPSCLLGTLLVIFVVLLLLGYLPAVAAGAAT
jgi:Protein of unknown function (DUF3309)